MRIIREAPYQFKFKFHEGYLWVKSPKGGAIRVDENIFRDMPTDLGQTLFILRAVSTNEMYMRFAGAEATIDVTLEEIKFFNSNKIANE